MNSAMRSITRLARPVMAKPLAQTSRTFTTFTPLRPTLTAPTAAIRPSMTSFLPAVSVAGAPAADLVPKSAISAHPALGGMQLRCGPRNTMNGATRLVQKRRLGFLTRMSSKTGRRILARRRAKGRKHLHS